MALIIVQRLESRQRIEALPGDQIEVELSEIPSTGYRWKASGVEEGILTEGSSSYVSTSDGIGGGGRRRIVYRTVGRGTCTIHFVLTRPWEGQQARDRFDLEVRVLDPNPTE